MSELQEIPPKPHAYLIAGGGGGLRSTIILRLITQELTAQDIDYTCIEGLYADDNGTQNVCYPSLQRELIKSDIEKRADNKPLLFIAHCIGTIAALSAVEEYEATRPVGLVSVAPPLSTPRSTIMRPQSQSKRSANGTLMRTVDLPEGAINYSEITEGIAKIDPQYFKDIDAAEDTQVRLRDRVATGRAAVYAPEYDWNLGSPICVDSWHTEWRSTRSADEAALLESRAIIVPNAAHGLYLSPRGAYADITDAENIIYQRKNVKRLVNTGVDLLSDAPINAAVL